jgi:NAD(P)H-dependent FMN reductase
MNHNRGGLSCEKDGPVAKIAVILGSTRQKRFGDKPAFWILDELKKRPGVEAELLDLRDFDMPFYDLPASPSWLKGEYGTEPVKRWRAKIDQADGFVMVAPEYNHGYSAILKNAIDHVYQEWNHKPLAFVSYGNVGGARAVEQLRQVAVEVQMALVKTAVHIPVDVYRDLMNEEAPVDAKRFAPAQSAADTMIDQLLWWTNALKAAREKTLSRAA